MRSLAAPTDPAWTACAVADIDTDGLDPDSYAHALRRNEAGNEVPLAFGSIVLRRIAVPA